MRGGYKSKRRLFSNRVISVGAIAVLLCVAVCVMFSQDACGQTSRYSVSEIQAAGVPNGLNNLGEIAGRAVDPATGEGRATKWNHGGLRRNILGKLAGGDYSSASKINDAGQIAGAGNISNSIVPFVWASGAGFRRIPLLPGDNCGQATAINKFGHVVGYSSGPHGKKAFLWKRGNSVNDLGVLPGGSYSTASDVNDSDDVVGASGSTAGDRAVLWTNTGKIIDLGTLPGDVSSEATAINNNGTVIGYSKGFQGIRAFVWTQASGMQQLGALPGGISSRALAINDTETVVGASTTASGDRAFAWTKQTGIRDLNAEGSLVFGAVLLEAHAINNRGQILALGINTHEMGNDSDSSLCAPAPPSGFLLSPQ